MAAKIIDTFDANLITAKQSFPWNNPSSICTTEELGGVRIATINAVSAPSTWTYYSCNFTAFAKSHTLFFGCTVDANRTAVLDDVSVVDTLVPTQKNTRFENLKNVNMDEAIRSTSWQIWCQSNNVQSDYLNSSESLPACRNITNLGCYKATSQFPAKEFLSQTFSTIRGHTYSINFWLIEVGNLYQPVHFQFDVLVT